MADYRYEQKHPITAVNDEAPVTIDDARLPYLTQILQNHDYVSKIETIVSPSDNLFTVQSGQNNILKFSIFSEDKALFSFPKAISHLRLRLVILQQV